MAARPKPLFWFTVFVIALALVGYSLHRAGILFAPKKAATVETKSQSQSAKTLIVTFYSSSAKKTWIDKMVQDFNSSRSKVGDSVVQVKTFHGNSGEQLDQMKDGKIKPDIWSPGY